MVDISGTYAMHNDGLSGWLTIRGVDTSGSLVDSFLRDLNGDPTERLVGSFDPQTNHLHFTLPVLLGSFTVPARTYDGYAMLSGSALGGVYGFAGTWVKDFPLLPGEIGKGTWFADEHAIEIG